MKKGDKVVIDDGSWSRIVEDSVLSYGPGGDRYQAKENYSYTRKQYVIIETGCIFPSTGAPRTFNDTIIQAIDSGKVIFIEERFLKLVLPKHKIKIMIDVKFDDCLVTGNYVEISDKLYQEIKRES